MELHTSARGYIAKCRDLWAQYKTVRKNVDALLLPFPGHYLVPFAWIITRWPRKTLMFDALISLYDTDVEDRRRVSRIHPWAVMLWIVDWLSMHLSDVTIIDTPLHKDYLVRTFGLRPHRVRVIELQARSDLFYPRPEIHPSASTRPVQILFYGTLIPLQGVDVIAAASKILDDQGAPVHFTFIGPKKLQDFLQGKTGRNVTIKPFATLPQIAESICRSHLCLGIFGTSGKALRVVPHKVVDAVACGVPLLTGDTPAIRDRYAGNPHVMTCHPGNAMALATAIMDFVRTC